MNHPGFPGARVRRAEKRTPIWVPARQTIGIYWATDDTDAGSAMERLK